MKKEIIVIVVLFSLLIGALGYIGIGKYQNNQFEMKQEIFELGAQYGYEQAVVSVINIASSCEAVPLRNGNVSLDVVAIECLQQGS